MPERKYSPSSGSGLYRYGFNGKENDNEVKGEGNQQDYGMRIYDPRLGRFLSVDPLTGKYPFYTPYQFSGNDVVSSRDLDGLEPTWSKNAVEFGKGILDNIVNFDSDDGFEICGDKIYKWSKQGLLDSKNYHFPTEEKIIKGLKNAFGTIKKVISEKITKIKNGDAREIGRLTGFILTLVLTRSLGSEVAIAGEGESGLANELNALRTENKVAQAEYEFGQQWGQAASYSVEGKTTSLLGNNEGYLKYRVQGSKNIVANDANPSGFSYLDAKGNFDFRTLQGRQTFWEQVNKPYINKIIGRGDRIVLTDNPFDQKAIFYQGDVNQGLNFFGREVQYLQEKGYTFINGEAIPPKR